MSELNGIVLDLDEREYHSHDSLSSTGARKLLESPARFHYAQQHPQAPKAAFDLGTATHSKVLGVGAAAIAYTQEHLTKSGNVSTAAATVAWAEVQRNNGLTPISPADMAAVDAMAESVLAHPIARQLFEQEGDAEASVFATDTNTGVKTRARFDFLPNFAQPDPIAVDLKTSGKDASPESFAKTVANFGYHIQDDFYRCTYGAATGNYHMPMNFVVVETAAPYLVGVYELAPEYLEIARAQVRKALATYAACKAADQWPGYPHENDPLQPPNWLIYQEGIEFD
jgi:hypothetical protein